MPHFIVGYVKADDNYFSGTYSNDLMYDALQRIADGIVELTLADKVDSLAREYFIHELDRHPSALANKERARRISQRLVESDIAGQAPAPAF